MGSRGPKPSGKVVVNTKIEPGTRDALHEAAARAGRTLSAEIEHRLRRSFDNDNLVENLGGPRLYAIMRTITAVMAQAGYTDRKVDDVHWLDDPIAYDDLVEATINVMRGLRPRGSLLPNGPRPDTGYLQDRRAGHAAAVMLADVAAASPTLPSPSEPLTDRELLARRIANGLGTSHQHLLATEEGDDDGTR